MANHARNKAPLFHSYLRYEHNVKVDRGQFESIVGSLLRQKPATREQQKTGSRKTSGSIILATPQSKCVTEQ
jgi:hypothetical protein